ncbi:carbohydrate-binding protein [Actinoplanes sp. NPDC023714]|uniref:carbohydrate-binding protein n=1 Tax=Actinoplanes sp. NPDC023714 TaxID=3154322 RepID=UPI0033ED08DF
MDHRSPNVYRTRSWTTRRRVLTSLGGVALVLLGYAIGRWQDTPAAVVPVSAPAVPSPAVTSAAAPVPATPTSDAPASAAPRAVDYPVIQAENATELAGIQTQETGDEGGGLNTAWITRSDHLRFDNLDFGEVPATKARLRISAASGVTGGRVEIRLDSRANAPVGEVSVADTGDWQKYVTTVAALQPITGVHTVFVTFAAPDDTEFVNVNWIQFAH